MGTDTVDESNGRGGQALLFMGVALLVFAVGLTAMGILSWFLPAQDPNGANAVRENLNNGIVFIMGVLAGIIVPKQLTKAA